MTTYTSNTLINNSYTVAPKANEEFIKSSLSQALEIRSKALMVDMLPASDAELDEIVNDKKSILKDTFGIVLTQKTKNKGRDFFCKMLFNLRSGYQQLKGLWKKDIELLIEALKYAKQLPETIYITFDCSEAAYVCTDEKAQLGANKDGWLNGDDVNPEDSEYWSYLNAKNMILLSSVYAISQMQVSANDIDMGFGNAEQDTDYVRSISGFRFIGSAHRDHHSFSGDDDKIVMMLNRPDNIDELIEKYEQQLNNL